MIRRQLLIAGASARAQTLRDTARPASEKHLFSYGKERFFRSFIAAIFIFGVGATYAICEGIEKIRNSHEIRAES